MKSFSILFMAMFFGANQFQGREPEFPLAVSRSPGVWHPMVERTTTTGECNAGNREPGRHDREDGDRAEAGRRPQGPHNEVDTRGILEDDGAFGQE